MSNPDQPRSVPTASTTAFLGTFGVVFALIAFFLVFDTFLARIDSAEASSRAAGEYKAGMRLSLAGEVDEAADRFRTAASMDRTHPAYSVALARALLAQGKYVAAERLLETILQNDPTDGAANVLMARVMVKENRIEEAKAHYHRAVYGRWRAAEGGSSMEARFELIELLASMQAKQELLAEILPIEDQSLDDLDLRNRIGSLFLVAGSPARANEVFREVIRKRPDDARAYAGLGAAAMALGNYRAAEDNLTRALRLAPNDSAGIAQLDVARALLALDPMRRGLRLSDRYDRSSRLVQLTSAEVSRCSADITARAAAAAASAAADSALRPARRQSEARMNDAIEENLSESQRLWAMRPAQCRQGTSPDSRALTLIQERLAR